MEFAVRPLGGWAVPYVAPVASAPPVFDADGRIREGPSRSSSIPADCGARQGSVSDVPIAGATAGGRDRGTRLLKQRPLTIVEDRLAS
jgi:hypothetical protein